MIHPECDLCGFPHSTDSEHILLANWPRTWSKGDRTCHAARIVIEAREFCAEEGNYPDHPLGPRIEDQCFDDWAADILEHALEGKAYPPTSYTVQVGCWQHRAATVTVTAGSLEEACRKAVADESLQFEGTDATTDFHVDSVNGDPAGVPASYQDEVVL